MAKMLNYNVAVNTSELYSCSCYIMTVDMDFGFVPDDPVSFEKLSR